MSKDLRSTPSERMIAMNYESCLLHCLIDVASTGDLAGVQLLLSYPSPSEEEWADVLHRARLIAAPASPFDILAVYEMHLGSRGVRTLLEREANKALVELRQLARNVNVPEEFVGDCVKLALLRASERSTQMIVARPGPSKRPD